MRQDRERFQIARPLRVGRGLRLLQPLESRDFALLFVGSGVSLIGDGIYLVAIAWQVYALTDGPSALALVGVAATGPQLTFLLLGGALSDRFSRRGMMVLADGIRAASVGAIGMLSLTGSITLWQLFALVSVYGIGTALFNPAYTAFLPSIMDPARLGAANALLQTVRPLAVRFAGPAIGGALITAVGTSTGFLVDAGSFLASMAAVLCMRTTPTVSERSTPSGGILREVWTGLMFVRTQRWVANALIASAIGLLFYLGPVQVLLPFLVKNHLHGNARDLGLVFAAGGIGAITAALLIGQYGIPRRRLPMMYGYWATAAAAPAGYALANNLWQAAITSAVSIGAMTAGQIIWTTSLQELVPIGLLGRVASVDLLASNALVPFSFALTGPAAALLGAKATMLFVGIAGSIAILIFLPLTRSAATAPVLAANKTHQ
jgi:MFS family permease